MIPRQKLYYQVCTDIPQKFLKKYFWSKNRSKSSFPPTFSANFSIFHKIRPDSSIGLSARRVCKISAKSDLICQKQLFGVQQNSKNWIFCTTINIVQNKRDRELKFSGSVEDHAGYNISENQPDPIKIVGATTILVQNTPKKGHFEPLKRVLHHKR